MTLPDFLMTGAPKAGTTALPVSPRTGGRIAKVTWTRNSPAWMFDEATLHRATVAPRQSRLRRRRVALLPVPPRIRAGSPPCQEIEQRLAALPAIAVPAVIPGSMADANFPATDQQPVQPPPDSRRSFVTYPAASPQPPRDALASKLKRTEIQHSPSSIPGRDIVQVLTEIPVGVESGWHTHPGEEVGYIVTGTVEMAIDGRATLTLQAGDGFLIPPRTPHNARDVGPGTGHMLSTYIVEAGQPLASFTGEPDDR